MNAHSHMDFTENARDSRGRFIPRPADDATEASSQYTATIRHSAGGYGAGDKFVFDPEIEPGAGDIVGLRHFEAELRNGVQIGRLNTHLPTARWADMPFGDAWGESAHTFAFQALEDDTPEIIDMARLVGIDLCVEVQRAEEADDAAPKQTRPTPPRGPDGRFLPRGHAEPEGEVKEAYESKPWEDVPNWTPEQSFMFRLEGDLYQLTALSAMLETLLTPITHKMAGYNRPASAALDYAVTNLADAVREIEERYMSVRFPEKEAA